MRSAMRLARSLRLNCSLRAGSLVGSQETAKGLAQLRV